MTTVVGYRTEESVYIGADSLASDKDGFKETRKDPKVFLKSGYLIGFCGSYRTGQLLMNSVKYPIIPKSDKNIYKFMTTKFVDAIVNQFEDKGAVKGKSEERILETEGSFLVAVRNHMFVIGEDFQVGETLLDYTAVGAGAEIAIGAMAVLSDLKLPPEDKVYRAMAAAETHNAFTSEPFFILNT